MGSEAQRAESMVPKRRASFSAGRTAARDCLSMMGHEAVDIPTQDRAPIWPEGLVGTITHSETQCLAAVASAETFHGLGVDLEPCRSVAPDMSDVILRPEERDMSDDLVLRSFSAKEAVYKALSSRAGRIMSFHEVCLHWGDGDIAHAELMEQAGTWQPGLTVPLLVREVAGHWLAISWVPNGETEGDARC